MNLHKFEKEILEIIDLSLRLNQKEYLASADGNISYRYSDDEILMTPTGVNKAFLKKNEFSVINLNGETLLGSPSGEKELHLEVYRRSPQARAVVHAHPPTAISWSVAYPELTELPFDALSEVILAVGKIPIATYAKPGGEELALSIRKFLPQNRVMILARHGALAWGDSLREAYNGIERLEHAAKVLFQAKVLGKISTLTQKDTDELFEMRKKLGPKIL